MSTMTRFIRCADKTSQTGDNEKTDAHKAENHKVYDSNDKGVYEPYRFIF